jgi:hypothetical protein
VPITNQQGQVISLMHIYPKDSSCFKKCQKTLERKKFIIKREVIYLSAVFSICAVTST